MLAIFCRGLPETILRGLCTDGSHRPRWRPKNKGSSPLPTLIHLLLPLNVQLAHDRNQLVLSPWWVLKERLIFIVYHCALFGLPWRLRSICLQCGRPRFDPWVGKIPWRRKQQPTPVLLPGKSHGWRSLVGYSPWGCKESDTTEPVHSLTHFVHYLNFTMCTCHPYSKNYKTTLALNERKKWERPSWAGAGNVVSSEGSNR